MSLQEMAITVLMCRDERRAEFMRRLAEHTGSVETAELVTMRIAATGAA